MDNRIIEKTKEDNTKYNSNFKYDAENKVWYYVNEKTKIVLHEHFAENGKTFKELWLHAFLYEADQIEKRIKAEENYGNE